jgi:hypothetical protein
MKNVIAHDVDAKRAEQIARNFLEQHYSIFDTKASIENETWLVEATTFMFDKESVKKLRIDPKTGRIISCE